MNKQTAPPLASSSAGLSGTGELVLEGAADVDHAAAPDYGVVHFAGMGGEKAFGELRISISASPVVEFTLVDGVKRRALNADIQVLLGWHR
jgi:hypothetical protein